MRKAALLPEGRTCGICGRTPLSRYNKNDFCNSHTAKEALALTNRAEAQIRESRELHSFVAKVHSREAATEIRVKKEKVAKPKEPKRPVTELKHYDEALRLRALRVTRLSHPHAEHPSPALNIKKAESGARRACVRNAS
jgi:hypothetical protein